jgi:hypothetical protein
MPVKEAKQALQGSATPAFTPGQQVIWNVDGVEHPVEITGVAGQMNGVTYYNIKGSKTAIPSDELVGTGEQMAPSTSVQTGLPGIGKTSAQAQMFGEVSGKGSQKGTLVDAGKLKTTSPLEGQLEIPEARGITGQKGIDAAIQEASDNIAKFTTPAQFDTVIKALETELGNRSLPFHGGAKAGVYQGYSSKQLDAMLNTYTEGRKALAGQTTPATTTQGVQGAKSGAGAPPVKPPEPPTATGIAPSGEIKAELNRIVDLATEQVKQDRAGTLKHLMQKIPGLRQLAEYERPGLKMSGENEKVLTAMVAERMAKSDIGTTALGSQVRMINDLKAAFGKDVVHGAKSDIKFIGTPEQAKNPITGTLKDIADNPELYELNERQKAELSILDSRNSNLLDVVNNGYGAEIGEFKAKPGGAFLPNVDIGEDVIEQLGSESRAAVSGRGKTRVFQTARDRMTSQTAFKPELDVEKLIRGLDDFKASAAGGQAYREVVGGFTRDEAMKATHPALYNRMSLLKKRLSSLQSSAGTIESNLHKAVDEFLHSPMEGTDIDSVRDALDIKLKGGPRKGFDVAQVQDEIAKVREELKAIKPAWEAANLKPYVFVQEGIYKYFKADTAKLIKESRQVTNNWLLNFIDRWRAGAFSGDLSPLAIQGHIGVLAAPWENLKAFAGMVSKSKAENDWLRSFKVSALAEDIAASPKLWGEYASLMGRDLSGVPKEYAAGFMSKIPGYDKFTESTYVTVTRESFNLWDKTSQDMMKAGIPEVEAKVAAANVVGKVYPLVNPVRLGQSPARAALMRSLPTSYSFIRQPVTLLADATKGLGKIATHQKLTPSEKLSVKMVLRIAASIMALSVSSAAISAKARGKSDKEVKQAMLDAINPYPYNGKFACLIIGDKRIPLGGPFRSIFRAIFPQEVEGVPFPVPFAGLFGMKGYLANRLNPAASTQLDVILNKDYRGTKIRKGNSTIEDFLRVLEYEVEGTLPLSIGEVATAAREGKDYHENIAEQAAAQFMGVNMVTLDNTYIDRLAKTVIPGFIDQLGMFDQAGLDAKLKDVVNPTKIEEIKGENWTYDITDLRTDINDVTSFLTPEAKVGAPETMPPIVKSLWELSDERDFYYKQLTEDEQYLYSTANPEFVTLQLFWGYWKNVPTKNGGSRKPSAAQLAAVRALCEKYNVAYDFVPCLSKD